MQAYHYLPILGLFLLFGFLIKSPEKPEGEVCTLEANHQSLTYGLDKKRHYQPLTLKLDKKRFKTNGSFLSFSHVEKYGQKQQQLEAYIYNWRKVAVVKLLLDTHEGKNWYSIDLSKACTNLNFDATYMLELKDGDQRTHYLRFQYAAPIPLEVALSADAKFLNCEGSAGNEVEFTSTIQGGISPYTIYWKLSAHQQGQNPIQTQENTIQPAGALSVSESQLISYQQPAYYVIMDVKDACGQQLRKTIHVTCNEGPNGENRINLDIINLNNGGNNGN